ncbi:MAG: alcohol dehydrogenase catalytic domain-containing protein [Spirochaetales bacterium]|nr:alcohol dehydrogenase catalytic domain-containing protein [Spirochaetales bacterium]MCF7939124.1 alcohol dehydrogenase catalytic domain-containing protein [Spirochaetales bacterium]
MKAIRLYDKEDIRIEDIPKPEIGNHEVLLRVKSAFVCGTDVRMYKNGKSGISPDNPRVMGHELAGVIEKTGSEVTHYKAGDRVSVAPNYGCGVCDFCVSGNSQLCSESEAIGISVDGGFAEYVRIPEPAVRQGNLMVLPENVSFEAGALAEPFSCVYNAYEKIGIYPGDRVLVIGAGPIGIMHAKIAVLAGAGQVYMNDLNTGRLEQAKERVPQIETLVTDDLPGEIDKITGGKGLDLVITAASVPVIQEMAFSLVGMNGRVMFFGGLPHGKSVVQLDTNEIHYKQLLISGTTRQSLRQYRKIIHLLSEGVLSADDIVTGHADGSEAESVLQAVIRGEGLKTSIRF